MTTSTKSAPTCPDCHGGSTTTAFAADAREDSRETCDTCKGTCRPVCACCGEPADLHDVEWLCRPCAEGIEAADNALHNVPPCFLHCGHRGIEVTTCAGCVAFDQATTAYERLGAVAAVGGAQ